MDEKMGRQVGETGRPGREKALRQGKMPINRQVDKKVVVHLHNGILCGHKKNEILSFVMARIDREGIMLSEISQTERVKIPHDFLTTLLYI